MSATAPAEPAPGPVVAVPMPPASAPAAPPRGGQRQAADEASWRKAFRDAQGAIDHFDRDLEEKRRFVGEAEKDQQRWTLSPETRRTYDQYKLDLSHADEDRARLQAQLDELEQQASNASVPREWRR
jgi:hypothetical protein